MQMREKLVSKSFKTLEILLEHNDPKIQLNAVKEILDYNYKILRMDELNLEENEDEEKEFVIKEGWKPKHYIPMVKRNLDE